MPYNTLGRNAAADGIADLITSVSLHTANPGEGGADEVAGNAYQRAATDGSQWAESQGASQNNAVIQFPEPTGGWGNVTHFAVHGAAGQLGWGALTTARNVVTGSDTQFAIGALRVSIAAS